MVRLKLIKVLELVRLLHFCAVSSFTAIIKVDTEVLKEKFSISSATFLIVLCKVFNSSLVGFASTPLSDPSIKGIYTSRVFLRKNELPKFLRFSKVLLVLKVLKTFQIIVSYLRHIVHKWHLDLQHCI